MTYYAKPKFLPYDSWFTVMPEDIKPLVEDVKEEPVTLHETMFRNARSKYNPFSVEGEEHIGGSEQCQQLQE